MQRRSQAHCNRGVNTYTWPISASGRPVAVRLAGRQYFSPPIQLTHVTVGQLRGALAAHSNFELRSQQTGSDGQMLKYSSSSASSLSPVSSTIRFHFFLYGKLCPTDTLYDKWEKLESSHNEQGSHIIYVKRVECLAWFLHVVTLTEMITDQYCFTSWQTTGKNNAQCTLWFTTGEPVAPTLAGCRLCSCTADVNLHSKLIPIHWSREGWEA
jgi:hypothetical protein